MSNESVTKKSPALAPVMPGHVVANVMGELTAMCRELEERRALGDDLAAWFAANPKQSDRFGAFQATRAKARAKLRARVEIRVATLPARPSLALLQRRLCIS